MTPVQRLREMASHYKSSVTPIREGADLLHQRAEEEFRRADEYSRLADEYAEAADRLEAAVKA